MKKFLTLTVAVLASIGLAQVVFAGPPPTGKEMVAPAPAPACFNWSGAYVGALGAYNFSVVNTHLSLNGDWNSDPDAQHLGDEAGSRSLDNDGGELGGVLGVNWQSNCWVFGVEATGGWLSNRDSRDSGTIEVPDRRIPDFHVRSSFQENYLFTFGPRIGYAFGNWLPYVTGGLASGDLNFKAEVDFPGIAQEVEGRPNNKEGGQDKQVNVGWFVGGGLQYALSAHWSIRAQYQYIDLGSESFNRDFHGHFDDFAANHFPANFEVELRDHNASFAIMYKF